MTECERIRDRGRRKEGGRKGAAVPGRYKRDDEGEQTRESRYRV